MGLPLAVVLAMLLVLVPVGFLTDSDEPATPQVASVATIAERVEKLRELEFERTPAPVTVTAEQAQREGIDSLDRDYPAEQRDADETILGMLGLLPQGTDLREEATSVFGEQVAGYYDPRTGRLRLVEGAAGSRVTNEMIIAHELVHALEDQALGLEMDDLQGSDDAALAYTAVVEGTATQIMYSYVDAHFNAEEALGGLLADSLTAPSTADLPPFLVAQLTFPYTGGQRFVQAVLRESGGWSTVDEALTSARPLSTEQILHPDKWFAGERPRRVTLPAPGPGYEERASGVFGEWNTDRLLRLSGQVQAEPSEGWGGDRYALYEGPDGPRVVIHWVHDSARDGTEFVEALDAYVDNGVPDGIRAEIDAGTDGVTLTLFER